MPVAGALRFRGLYAHMHFSAPATCGITVDTDLHCWARGEKFVDLSLGFRTWCGVTAERHIAVGNGTAAPVVGAASCKPQAVTCYSSPGSYSSFTAGVMWGTRSMSRAQVFHLRIASSSPCGLIASACSYSSIASRSH